MKTFFPGWNHGVWKTVVDGLQRLRYKLMCHSSLAIQVAGQCAPNIAADHVVDVVRSFLCQRDAFEACMRLLARPSASASG
jgi:hypothetical protein